MSIAVVIEWKLRQLNKFVGAKVRTEEGVLISWDANGEPQPDTATLQVWSDEYAAFLLTETSNKRGRKRQLLDALATLTGLTRKQVLKCFMEIVQDGNDD